MAFPQYEDVDAHSAATSASSASITVFPSSKTLTYSYVELGGSRLRLMVTYVVLGPKRLQSKSRPLEHDGHAELVGHQIRHLVRLGTWAQTIVRPPDTERT